MAPSERVVVDVLFGEPGELTLEHRTPEHTYQLASITVSGDSATPNLAKQFEDLRTNSDMAAERKRIQPYLDAAPDKTLAFECRDGDGRPRRHWPGRLRMSHAPGSSQRRAGKMSRSAG